MKLNNNVFLFNPGITYRQTFKKAPLSIIKTYFEYFTNEFAKRFNLLKVLS